MNHSIEVKNLRKKYRVYFEKPALIRNILPFFVSQGKAQEFWALNGISFSMEKGECVGIIGPNGSGKSTILSILAGVSSPTEGEVSIRGRISSLLSLGAGFNFELTGQENVYLNGAILGLSKAEIDVIYHDIVAFADLGKFMNAKLSTYSAGMNMRLGFAIAVMVPFNVLLMDEILAVGDLAFQTKCFRTMRKFWEDEGKTIIFVSHDLVKIEEICSSVIWFEHGQMETMGPPSEVIAKYMEKYREKLEIAPALKARPVGRISARITVDAGKELRELSPTLFGSNIDMAGDGVYLWDGAGGRVNEHVLGSLRPLAFRLLRYPGANADNFHWREALGESRVAQMNPIDHSMRRFHPSFGPAEFLAVCAALDTVPMVVLNAGTGTPDEATGWVSWIRERYRGPLYVEIGHELYYDEFHPLGAEFPWTPEHYARRYEEFARSIRAEDPTASIGIQCCLENGNFPRYRDGRWNETVLSVRPDLVDFLSIHNASLPIINITPDYSIPSEEHTYTAVMAASHSVESGIAALSAQAAHLRGRGDTPIALSEYGCYFTNIPDTVHGTHRIRDRSSDSVEWGRNRTLAAAMYEALVLHAAMRQPAVFLAARHTMFHNVFSSLAEWDEGGQIIPHPQYYIHRLYNKLAGKTLVSAEIEVEGFSSPPVGFVPAQHAVPYLDLVCAKNGEGTKLALYVVNRSLNAAARCTVDIRGFAGTFASTKVISGESFRSVSNPSGPDPIYRSEYSCASREMGGGAEGRIHLSLPSHSVTVLSVGLEDWL